MERKQLHMSTWALRISFGLMYLYSGIDLVLKPEAWEGFIPEWLYALLGSSEHVFRFIQIQGVGEFVLGLLFLVWLIRPKIVGIAALLSALEMALILLLVGVDNVTFRDIGLLGAAFSLFIATRALQTDTPP